MATKAGLETLKISRSQPLGRTHAMTKGVPGAHGSRDLGTLAAARHVCGANGVWRLPRAGVNVLVLAELLLNTLGREQNQTRGV